MVIIELCLQQGVVICVSKSISAWEECGPTVATLYEIELLIQ